MVAETLTGRQAGPYAKVYKQYIAGMTHTAFGTYSVAANVEDGDIFELCFVPAGALVVGGAFWCSDIDVGTEALDMDIGWADNGAGAETLRVADGTVYTNMLTGVAAPAGFVNSGVLTGDAITDLIPAGVNYRPFVMSSGPVYFASKTKIQAEANTAAATFAAGTLFTEVRYLLIG